MTCKALATFTIVLSTCAMLSACGGRLSPSSMQTSSATLDIGASRRFPHNLVPRVGGHPGGAPPIAMFASITESGIEAVVRGDSAGKKKVNPYGLHPPAVLEDGPSLPGVPYQCWTVTSPPPQAPPGTTI